MNKKQFRIAAKNIFLTYSQVNPEITAEHILEQFKQQFYEFNYVIAKEFHEDGGTHFHVILISQTKFDIKRADKLDIQYKDQSFHGNYASVKQLKQAISYVCKDKNFITNLENIQNGKLLSAKEFIIKQVNEKGVEKALIDYYEQSPDKALAGISVSALKKQFHDIEKLKRSLKLDTIETPFGLDHFDIHAQLKQWVDNPNKTLVLVGDSGIGKTQFCKAFVKKNNFKTLMVNHKEDFRRLDESYDAIIVDDANIHELEETQLLSLIDNQTNKTLRVLYDTVTKKANIVQLIAMNLREFDKISSILKQPRFARRLLLQKPNKPFMLNINIQINNGCVINNYNQPQTVELHKHQEDEELHVKRTQQMITDIQNRRI